jgi:outer membrane biosynthesis protein TonB
MSGLFIQLDAEYATDEEFIEAGPHAELLYIRALAFCKRKMLDGRFTRNQLAAVALGIPNPRKAADALVAVGLWSVTAEGWEIPAWLKRNKPAAQIVEEREMRRMASVEANHAQHHVGEGKRPSPKCELCRSGKAPKSAPKSEANRTVWDSTEEEPEPEPEEQPQPQPQEEPEPYPEKSSSKLKLVEPAAVDDDDFRTTATIAALAIAKKHRAEDESSYARSTLGNFENDGHAAKVRARLAEGDEPIAIAALIAGSLSLAENAARELGA